MARKPGFDTVLLEKMLADGSYNQGEMARMLKISDSQLSEHLEFRRRKDREKSQMIAASRVTICRQADSIWNATVLIDEVCEKVRPMLQAAEDPKDVAMLAKVLMHAEDSIIKILEKLIVVEQQHAFDKGILKALKDASDEVERQAIANIKAFKAEAGLLFNGELT